MNWGVSVSIWGMDGRMMGSACIFDSAHHTRAPAHLMGAWLSPWVSRACPHRHPCTAAHYTMNFLSLCWSVMYICPYILYTSAHAS